VFHMRLHSLHSHITTTRQRGSAPHLERGAWARSDRCSEHPMYNIQIQSQHLDSPCRYTHSPRLTSAYLAGRSHYAV
jgi:hypothetical protein